MEWRAAYLRSVVACWYPDFARHLTVVHDLRGVEVCDLDVEVTATDVVLGLATIDPEVAEDLGKRLQDQRESTFIYFSDRDPLLMVDSDHDDVIHGHDFQVDVTWLNGYPVSFEYVLRRGGLEQSWEEIKRFADFVSQSRLRLTEIGIARDSEPYDKLASIVHDVLLLYHKETKEEGLIDQLKQCSAIKRVCSHGELASLAGVSCVVVDEQNEPIILRLHEASRFIQSLRKSA